MTTYGDKLREMQATLKQMAAECLASDDVECAHELTGAYLVICELNNKLSGYAVDDNEWRGLGEKPTHD